MIVEGGEPRARGANSIKIYSYVISAQEVCAPSRRAGNRGNAALLRDIHFLFLHRNHHRRRTGPQPVLCSRSRLRQKFCFWFSANAAVVNFTTRASEGFSPCNSRRKLRSSTCERVHPKSGFRACKSIDISVHKSLCKAATELLLSLNHENMWTFNSLASSADCLKNFTFY